MSATNSTTTYHLPIFLGTDVPSWLTDWNSAMSDIDIAIAAAKTTADAAQLTASNAQNAATTNAGAISTLQTTVAGQGNSITTLSGSVNTINSLIGNGLPTTTDQTIIGAINELHANQGDLLNLTTTDKSSLVSAINEIAGGGGGSVAASAVSYDNTGSGLTATDVQAAIDELAQGGSSEETLASATADGNTTFQAILNQLYAAIDTSKLSPKTVLIHTTSTATYIYRLDNYRLDSGNESIGFSSDGSDATSNYQMIAILKPSGSVHGAWGSTFTNTSSNNATNGQVFTVKNLA